MAYYYLKSNPVPIPLDRGPVVIRRETTVEYEISRTYSTKTKNSKVQRRVIGRVDPSHPGMMFPKYGTTEGTCNLDASPMISNVADSPLTIYWRVTADHYETTTGSAKVTISKAAQSVPAAPTAESVTENSVTLKQTEGYQYSLDGTAWQDSNVFSGLSQNKEYTFYQRIAGDANHETSPASQGTAIITGSYVYRLTATGDDEHTIESGKDAVYIVKRSVEDDRTFDNYTGATVDGKEIPENGSTAEKGSLILTLKSSYLDTLSVGDHKVTILFTDRTVEAPLKIKATAPTPRPVPQTGDKDNPVLWIGLILLGIAGLAVLAVLKSFRKRK